MITALTLIDLARTARDTYDANVVVRNDRGNGAAGPAALKVDSITELSRDDDDALDAVTRDDDPEAWRLATEAHAALSLSAPTQVWAGEERHPGEYIEGNAAQAIYSV